MPMEIRGHPEQQIPDKHNIKKGNVVMEAFIAAGASITVGVLSLVGVIITNANSNRKIEQQLETAQAVTDCYRLQN